MKIRAFIVDDEPLARQRIRLLSQEVPDLEIKGEYASGKEALDPIKQLPPDLLFLDVQMPEMNGFQLLERLPRECLPLIIFTTAYDRHAVRAFEAHALDYLLKPFNGERFHSSVSRAREHLANREAGTAARGLLDLLAARQSNTAPPPVRPIFLSRFTIRNEGKVVVLKIADVDSIESAGNYVAVNSGRESHILRETLNNLEAQLDPELFLRVSRSAIVNLDQVKELQPMFKGEHIIVLQNGKRLVMTRGLREVEHTLKFT
jgi:two-component system LytT family response regulator